MEERPLMDRCFGGGYEKASCPEQFHFNMIPYFVFWISIPFQYLSLMDVKSRQNDLTRWAYIRMTLALLLVANETSDMVVNCVTPGHFDWNGLAMNVFGIITVIAMTLSYLISIRRGRRSNGFVIITYIIMFCSNVSIFLMNILDRSIHQVEISLWIRIVILIVINAVNGVNDLKTCEDKEQNVSPENECSFYSRIFMSWMDSLIVIGQRKDLTAEDLYPLRPNSTSKHLMEKWDTEWTKIVDEYNLRKKTADGTAHVPPPSILWAIFRIFKRCTVTAMSLRFLADVITYVNPFLLIYLINFVSEESAPLSYGILIVICMFILSEMRSFLNNNYIYVATQNSTHVQSILNNAVFKKTLRLSAIARNERTVGEVINFMSVDIEKILMFVIFSAEGISCPLQIMLAMIFLSFLIGVAAIPGIIFMLSFIPINYCSSLYIKKYQSTQMKVKDERTKMCNEVLNGMKLIKLYAWEEAFEKKINDLRKEEVRILRLISIMSRGVDAANNCAPFLVAVITFACFILFSSENVLTPQIAFVCIAIFNQIRLPMKLIAMLVNFTVQMMVSRKRLEEFMVADEMKNVAVKRSSPGYSLQISNGTFNWSGPNDTPTIRSLNVNLRKGELHTIVGPVGSGKSSVLGAILGEMFCLEGNVAYSGSIAYVPQQAWLQNNSLRNNIIFGKEFDPKLYARVVDAAELTIDFNEIEFGDLTEVGENGITLSGGQKARIGIARALYQQADIYLLDDCLSAVDAHVGAAVFTKAFSNDGILKDKTRILVTHGLQYTKTADRIYVMKDGMVIEEGNYKSLTDQNGVFNEMVQEKEGKAEEQVDDDEDMDDMEGDLDANKRTSRQSSMIRQLSSKEKEANVGLIVNDGVLVKNETMETGRVKLGVYLKYMNAATLKWTLSFVILYVVHMGFTILRSLWLSDWSNEADVEEKMSPTTRLVVYTSIGLGEVVTLLITQLSLVMGCQSASYRLHSPLLHSVLRSPMSFFDTTPIGRILNRLSRDLEVIDNLIPVNIGGFANCLINVLLVLILISYSTPIFILAIFPLGGVYLYILRYFLPTVRQIKRMESVKRSPILSLFGESIQGCSSIRAYNKVEATCTEFAITNDVFAQCRYLSFASNRWLALRLELLGNVIILLAGLFAVISTRFTDISPGIVGMSVSYAFSFTEMLYFGIRMLSELETNVVSVERVDEYSRLEQEAEWRSEHPPPSDWPQNGEIRWKNFSTRYRPELPLVMSNFSASTRASEKVGVVGRTGSGKSSLTLALYRLIESAGGTILIDGIDISTIGLHELRSKITIIPQEPVLFSGSLRFNLDPFDHYSDEQVWKALEACQLNEYASSQPGQLSFEIAEGGKNMSVGQRQLVCLGRALLRKGRILVLDEATAACDVQTDASVQDVIRTQFSTSTVIAIAHRLNTIANYDRILVLEKGSVAEFDSPHFLLTDPNSKYSKMVEKSKKHS